MRKLALLTLLLAGCNTFYDPEGAPLQLSGADAGTDAAVGDASGGGGNCVPESDPGLCSLNDAHCGPLTAEDRCGQEREVDCGGCPPGWTCGLETPNVCGCPCEADGACVAPGARHPDGSCQLCGESGWEIVTSLACSDGDPCTLNDACQEDGACAGAPLDCTPDDCATSGQCDPATGTCVYEAGPDGDPCADDGLDCTTDVCMGGVCTHERIAFTCIIDGECVADGAPDAMDQCTGCNSTMSPFSWGSLPDGASCADGTGTCSGGECLF